MPRSKSKTPPQPAPSPPAPTGPPKASSHSLRNWVLALVVPVLVVYAKVWGYDFFLVWVQNFLRKSTPDGVQTNFLSLTDVCVLLILATAAEIWGPKFLLEIAASWGPISYSNDFLTYVGGVEESG